MKIGSLPTTAAGVGTSAAGAAEGAMVGAPRGAAVGAAVGAGGAGASHECSWHQMPWERSPLHTSSVGKSVGLISQLCEPSASTRRHAPVPVQYWPKMEPGPWWTDSPSTFLQHLESVHGASGASSLGALLSPAG